MMYTVVTFALLFVSFVNGQITNGNFEGSTGWVSSDPLKYDICYAGECAAYDAHGITAATQTSPATPGGSGFLFFSPSSKDPVNWAASQTITIPPNAVKIGYWVRSKLFNIQNGNNGVVYPTFTVLLGTTVVDTIAPTTDSAYAYREIDVTSYVSTSQLLKFQFVSAKYSTGSYIQMFVDDVIFTLTQFTTSPLTTAQWTSAAMTTMAMTTAEMTTAEMTTAEFTSAAWTSAALTTAPMTTHAMTTAQLTTAEFTSAAWTSAAMTTKGLTTKGLTTQALTTSAMTTAYTKPPGIPVGFYDECSGNAADDPLFRGFHGQKYTFDGLVGKVYSMFNDKFTSLNAKFAPSNPMMPEIKGSIMKTFGLIVGKTPIVINANDKGDDSVVILMDRNKVEIKNQQKMQTDDCVELSYSSGTLIISTLQHQFTVTFMKKHAVHLNTTYLNIQISYPIENEKEIRGVLGQSADASAKISHKQSDFEVSAILATDSQTGVYSSELAPSACGIDTANPITRVREATFARKTVNVNCTYPTNLVKVNVGGLATLGDGETLQKTNFKDNGLTTSALPVPLARDGTEDSEEEEEEEPAPPTVTPGVAYYIANNVNTLANFTYLSSSVTATDFRIQINTEGFDAAWNPFEDGPWFDLSTNRVYFKRNPETLDASFSVTLTVSWTYETAEALSLTLQFCPDGVARCDGSVDPVPRERVKVRGELCYPNGTLLENLTPPVCVTDAKGKKICTTYERCTTSMYEAPAEWDNAKIGTDYMSPSYCSVRGVCTAVPVGTILGSAKLQKINKDTGVASDKAASEIEQGDVVVGSSGEAVVVIRIDTQTIYSGNLLSINGGDAVFTSDVLIRKDDESNKIYSANLGSAINMLPGQAADLKQLTVGSVVEVLSEGWEETTVTSIKLTPITTATVVYSFTVIPTSGRQSEDNVFEGVVVEDFAITNHVHVTAASAQDFMISYVVNALDATFYESYNAWKVNNPGVTAKTFVSNLMTGIAVDLNKFIKDNLPDVEVDDRIAVKHFIDWDSKVDASTYPLEEFLLRSKELPIVLRAGFVLSPLFKATPENAQDFLDRELIPEIKTLIQSWTTRNSKK